jgi:hypothetical protein
MGRIHRYMDSGKQTPQAVRRQPRKRRNLYRGVTAEISLKLILSWAIAISAIASFFRLLPYHLTQQAKLKELNIQVQETDARVTKLREQLNHNFDPQETQSLREQYTTLTQPNQSRIYWLEDKSDH